MTSKILSEVFGIENGAYARENAFWRSRGIEVLVDGENEEAKERIARLRGLYDELSSIYQASKGESDIPLG